MCCHYIWNPPRRILMLRRPSSVRPSSVAHPSVHNFKHLLLRTACPIKAKFYMEPPWVGVTNDCSRHLGHMTKMAATPIYGKNPARPSSVAHPSVHNFKHLLLRNRLPDQSQILYGAFLGRGNEILFAASGSHDQDGRHIHIW